MRIIDGHSHIDYITHNFQTGVVGTVCCTTNEFQWRFLVDMAKRDNGIYPCFGVHPWFVNEVENSFDVRLKNLLESNQSYLVGEIGLDKFRPNMERQIECFIKQLNVAIDLQRTVILHCVGAWDKIFHILKQYKKDDLPVIVVHGFNDSGQIMKFLLDNYDVMFSVGKNVLYGRNSRIEQIPVDKIMVETDGNSNVNLCDLIDEIAKIKNEQNMANIIYENSTRLLTGGIKNKNG